MGSSTKNQKIRSDNRCMTGNVNIYICSEAVEKNEKNAEENVTQHAATLESSASQISEKSRQKVEPIDEHLASPNRVRKKLAAAKPEKQHNFTTKKDAVKDSNSIDEQLISTTDFNKFTSHESKSNPTVEQHILKNTNKVEQKINDDNTSRYDRSNMVSCRCPRFDESDLWLQKALKRQNRDSIGVPPSYSVKKSDQKEQQFTDAHQKISAKSEGSDKLCTCDRIEKHDNKGNRTCEQLCTCCCIDVHKKENINKKKMKEIKKETSTYDKTESSTLRKKDKKTTENQAEFKVTNSKDDSKDTKENLKTKKSNSSDKVIKVERRDESKKNHSLEKVKRIDKVIKVANSNESKKNSKELLPPIESESKKKSKKDMENVEKSQKKSKLSMKSKANKENSDPTEKPQDIQSPSKEKKKIKKEKKSAKTKKIAIKENSESKSSDPRQTKKRKEKRSSAVFNTDKNETSHRNKVINDRKENSFFSKLINMMKSNNKANRRDIKKRGCSPNCTGLTRAKASSESSTKNKSDRENSEQKSKLSGTIISTGSHYIPNQFHNDFKSGSDTQVNNTVETENAEKTDNTTDHSLDRYDDRKDRYPRVTKIDTEHKSDEPYSRLEQNCSCYDCRRKSEAACDQFSFSDSHPQEDYFEKSIESCCACKPLTSFKEDRRSSDLRDDRYLLMTNKLGRGSPHCCWCSCRDNA